MLIGRERELEQLDALLREARLGRGRALVLRGSAGIGKTVLLDYAAQQASGFQVLHYTAVESEAELPFAGLQALLGPLLVRLPEIPEPQARAVRAALALEWIAATNRLAVYAGALSLFGVAAERVPLLVVVDDAHWVDRPSAEALTFAARRLTAESLALLFAVREGEGTDLGVALPTIELGPLEAAASMELLRERFGSAIAAKVARHLAAATGGNPLALLEVAALLDEGERAGSEPLPDYLPASESVERTVRRTLRGLPPETRRALLAAATSDSPMGGDLAALEPAEDAGLVRIHAGAVAFRHPLVRSAVYHAAPADERRAAHRTLADALTGEEDSDRRAWHLAAAAEGPDESVAAALEAAASRFVNRGGQASASRALERAAELSEDDDACARRLHAAGRAAEHGGDLDRAGVLAERALTRVRDAGIRSAVTVLAWQANDWRGLTNDGVDFETEAQRVAPFHPARAALMLYVSSNEAFRTLDLERALRLARKSVDMIPVNAARQAPGSWEPWMADVAANTRWHLAFILLLLGRPSEADEAVRGLLLPATGDLWANYYAYLERYDEARSNIERVLRSARETGDAWAEMWLTRSLAFVDLLEGRFPAARAGAARSLGMAESIAVPGAMAFNLAYLAWLAAVGGREAEAREDVARADDLAQLGVGYLFLRGRLQATLGLLELGLSRPLAAIEKLVPVADLAERHGVREPGFLRYAPDLIEAYARAGEREAAMRELAKLAELAGALDRRWALAAVARLHGLLGTDDDLDEHFGAALELHEGAGSPFERARTELLYGERLRRAKRRVDAREHLRSATELFDGLGAAPWSEQARSELRASGESIPRRDPTAPEKLTPQELQIALQVAEGRTNRDVAAALFLSPKTVEFHLTRVYRKLSIHSRAELVRLFSSERASATPEPLRRDEV
ncbi:MAG: helix-turn-helix transcriptional regulator [Actinobacteria bacterium]|nr:MAG: helix-turn-helix transcriptional regulator [Actinomycetota bacterium]